MNDKRLAVPFGRSDIPGSWIYNVVSWVHGEVLVFRRMITRMRLLTSSEDLLSGSTV